jgi:hypothetical protein
MNNQKSFFMSNPKKLKTYGFNVININGLDVFSIGVLFSLKNVDIIQKYGIPHTITSTNKVSVEFASTDALAFNNFSQSIGKAMKEIAQRDLNSKYSWVN